MTQSKTQKIIKDTNGKEVVMIRIDKTLQEMTEEKPQSRWDVKYWHPQYDYLATFTHSASFLSTYLVDSNVISADSVRASRGESYQSEKNSKHPYYYMSVDGILPTGYDFSRQSYGSKDAYERLKRSELKYLDIAIARSGVGSLGKSFIFLEKGLSNIVSDLYIIRCDGGKINPFYILLLLKTRLGKDQIERNEKGVSGQTKLTTDMIANFLVPEMQKTVQDNIEKEYIRAFDFHERAIKSKNEGNEGEYKKNLDKAEKMLKDLIARTEAVIRGEREDVI